jgi:hypothetical protein
VRVEFVRHCWLMQIVLCIHYLTDREYRVQNVSSITIIISSKIVNIY